jgi:5-methylcytosine-specific restriction endonuclease McrA
MEVLQLIKACKICCETKAPDAFKFQNKRKGTRRHICKLCANGQAREWFKLNPERAKATARRRYAEAPEAALNKQKARDPGRSTRRYHADPEHAKAHAKRSADRNPGMRNAIDSVRRARKRSACPIWLTVEQHQEMRSAFKDAGERGLQVDHITPIAGCRDCGSHGLHVPWNLQLLTASENAAKRNRCQVCWDAVRGGAMAKAMASHGGPPSNVADTYAELAA